MKLLVVLSIKEYQRKVASLLEEAGVRRFSVSDITGYKKREESLGWFAAHPNIAKTDSIVLFSFTTGEIAGEAIRRIDSCNLEVENPFPVHAFIVDVEKFSNLV
jgi:hypothetical protein